MADWSKLKPCNGLLNPDNKKTSKNGDVGHREDNSRLAKEKEQNKECGWVQANILWSWSLQKQILPNYRIR